MRLITLSTFGAASIVALLAFAAPARAQAADPKQEIQELFKKVEKDLKEIDKLLLDAANNRQGASASTSSSSSSSSSDSAKSGASAGAKEETGGKASARTAHSKQKSVASDIQKIIDLVPPGGSCNNPGGSCDNPGNSGGKPSSSGGEKPQNPGEEKTAQGDNKAPKPDQGGQDPNDPRKSQDPAQMAKSPYRPQDTERNPRTDGVERWGDLPEHARKAFSNENTDDLPLRYRKWIQDFYKRVNKGAAPNK